jgi:hypothetical protein
MTKEETLQCIKVMQAYVDGKTVQARYGAVQRNEGNWHAVNPHWDWVCYEYRVKPEPMEIVVWVDPEGIPVSLNTFYPPTGVAAKKKFREVVE